MKFKKDDEGKLVLDDAGDPIAIDGEGNPIPLDKVVSLGKFQRVESERDEHKAQAEKLSAQIAELQKASGDSDELKKQLAELAESSAKDKADFEARIAARDKEHALEAVLLKAGCRDTKAARAHVDLDALKLEGEALAGFDAETFKKDRAYLFESGQRSATAAAAAGGTGKISLEEAEKLSMDEYAAARKDGKL